jgi:transcriptional regulator with XRE-family HTH domain
MSTDNNQELPLSCFADRLKVLIGNSSVSAFARKVALSESLIRKYLKGSEPSLSRAAQIARRTEIELEWLAFGQGEPLRRSVAIDAGALRIAQKIKQLTNSKMERDLTEFEGLAVTVATYQYVLSNRSSVGYFDERAAYMFADQTLRKLIANKE